MRDLFLLSGRQMAHMLTCFPLAHGAPKIDDRSIVSGIVYVIRNDLRSKDVPKGPTQNTPQALHTLEPTRHIRSDLWQPGGRTKASAHQDRFHPSEVHRTAANLQAARHAALRRSDERPQWRTPDARCRRLATAYAYRPMLLTRSSRRSSSHLPSAFYLNQ